MKIAPKPPDFSKIRRGPGTFPAEILTTAEPNHHLSPSFPRNPLSPPSAPVQGRLQSPPAKSKFLAVRPPARSGRSHKPKNTSLSLRNNSQINKDIAVPKNAEDRWDSGWLGPPWACHCLHWHSRRRYHKQQRKARFPQRRRWPKVAEPYGNARSAHDGY